jgi:hypothetical protein
MTTRGRRSRLILVACLSGVIPDGSRSDAGPMYHSVRKAFCRHQPAAQGYIGSGAFALRRSAGMTIERASKSHAIASGGVACWGATSKQGANDFLPFGISGNGCRRASGLAVPVACVAQISLDPMQIGVDPCRFTAVLIHDDRVCMVPVALGCPPQRREGRRDIGGRGRCSQRPAEFVGCHRE